MAIVKIMPRKNASSLLRYVFKKQEPGDPVDAEGCATNEAKAKEDFHSVRNAHEKEGGNEAYHVIQSWSVEESSKLTPEEVNKMGRKLVENYFEGHKFVVVTHNDDGRLHNHIAVNAIHTETGRRIKNKKEHLYKLRAINDEICLSRGLSIPNQEAKLRAERMPDKVQRMVRYGRTSYIHDTKQKADLARSMSQNFEEYQSALSSLGIRTRVENKNITYFYPGKARGKRGSKLGTNYDKSGLEEAFTQNQALYRARPDLKSKDAIQALHAASRKSTLAYCKENKILLELNAKGQTVLKGRPHVIVNNEGWENTKNKTQGGIIDFVAIHHKSTLLQAASKLTGNTTLLALEEHFGEQKRKFTSFYIPKSERLSAADATQRVAGFLRSFGANPRASAPLLKSGRAQVSREGWIRFIGPNEKEGVLDFSQDERGNWKSMKRGSFRSPFHSSPPTGKRLVLFTSPQSFVQHHGTELFSERPKRDGILALMEPHSHAVDRYLDQHRGVSEVHLVPLNGKSLSAVELDFFNNLKSRYPALGLKLEVADLSRERSRECGPELDL